MAVEGAAVDLRPTDDVVDRGGGIGQLGKGAVGRVQQLLVAGPLLQLLQLGRAAHRHRADRCSGLRSLGHGRHLSGFNGPMLGAAARSRNVPENHRRVRCLNATSNCWRSTVSTLPSGRSSMRLATPAAVPNTSIVVHPSLPAFLGPYSSPAFETITSPERRTRSSLSSVPRTITSNRSQGWAWRMMTKPGGISTTTATGVLSSLASPSAKYEALMPNERSFSNSARNRSGACQ